MVSFHLTKYSHSCLFNCLDLSIASISNSGSLSMKLDGGFELYFWLSLEASRVTNLKIKTWNMRWTLRFFYNSSLKMLGIFFSNTLNGPTYGPKNSWFKPSGKQIFLMFNHTSFPCSKFTSCRNLFKNPSTIFVPFRDWPWPFPTSATFLYQITWPLALPHLHHLGVAIHGPNHRHDWWLAHHHLKRCGPCCRMF